MLQKAVSKVRAEMTANKTNQYIQVVGEFLIQHLTARPEDAEKVLNPDKTIAKSLGEMRKEAEKKKVGNCAVLTPSEGFNFVLKYFGIKGKSAANNVPAPMPVAAPAEPIKETPSFDIRLEDLL